MQNTTRASLFAAMRNAVNSPQGVSKFSTVRRHPLPHSEPRKPRVTAKGWYRIAEERRGDWS